MAEPSLDKVRYRLMILANAATVVFNDKKATKMALRNHLYGLVAAIRAELAEDTPL